MALKRASGSIIYKPVFSESVTHKTTFSHSQNICDVGTCFRIKHNKRVFSQTIAEKFHVVILKISANLKRASRSIIYKLAIYAVKVYIKFQNPSLILQQTSHKGQGMKLLVMPEQVQYGDPSRKISELVYTYIHT